MAKNTGPKTTTPSRIRFVILEAELGDGDIGQITHAIQNALRAPIASPVKRLAVGPNAATIEPEIESDVDDIDDGEVVEATAAPSARARTGSRKPPPTPDIVEIDMNSDVSLATFALGKDSKSQTKKYLIAAAWLKEHRGISAVTAGHIYTCFRSMEWSVGIPDFWQPLRDLKSKKFFSKNGEGSYEINHLGLDFVKKLGGSHGTG